MDKVRAFTVGGVDYVTKPFQYEEVAARVATHLKIGRLQADLEKRNEELRQTNEELLRLQQLRDNLVHMIIHDMNSPLGAMIGFIGLCKSSAKIPSEIAGYLAHASTAARKLAEMVRSMLDISKMEAGQLRLNRTDCDLAALAREIFEQFESLRGKRSFKIDSPRSRLSFPWTATSSAVCCKILSANALKYAPDGSALRIALQSTESAARVSCDRRRPGNPAGISPAHFLKNSARCKRMGRDSARASVSHSASSQWKLTADKSKSIASRARAAPLV